MLIHIDRRLRRWRLGRAVVATFLAASRSRLLGLDVLCGFPCGLEKIND